MLIFADMEKATFLIENGWIPIPGQSWKAPVTFGRPLYFDLETAYALETTGVGVWAYAADQELVGQMRASDVDSMNEREANRFAQTGVYLGNYPNF